MKSRIAYSIILLFSIVILSGCTGPVGIFEYAGDKDPVTVPMSTHTMVNLDFQISVGSITLEVDSDADYLVNATNKVSIREGSDGELKDAEEITYSESDTDTMKVEFDSDDEGIQVDYKYDIVIKVNNNITLQINFAASTGDLSTTISDETIEISSLAMSASTGAISLTLSDVEFSVTNPKVTTSTGDQSISLSNIDFTTSTTWDITLSTGSIEVDLIDTNTPNDEAMTQKFNVAGSTGSITITTDFNQDFGVRVTATVPTGEITLPGGSESPYISNNFDSADQKYDFALSTSTGDIIFT